MPKTTTEYYRYQRRYTARQAQHPDFPVMRNHDLESLRRQRPEDCNDSIVLNCFREDHEDGGCTYHHFENQAEMMRYKAIVFNDISIYRDWLKERDEEKILREYDFRNRKGGTL